MGFTRYWTLRKEIPQEKFDTIVEYTKVLLDKAKEDGIKIGKWDGEGGEPELEKDIISFNGVGDDSHESFVLPRKPKECEWDRSRDGWDFCKTQHKPYDRVVYEVLYMTYKLLGDKYFEFSGDDGTNSEAINENKPFDTSNVDTLIRDGKITEIVD
jgi:hypothetical protein